MILTLIILALHLQFKGGMTKTKLLLCNFLQLRKYAHALVYAVNDAVCHQEIALTNFEGMEVVHTDNSCH